MAVVQVVEAVQFIALTIHFHKPGMRTDKLAFILLSDSHDIRPQNFVPRLQFREFASHRRSFWRGRSSKCNGGAGPVTQILAAYDFNTSLPRLGRRVQTDLKNSWMSTPALFTSCCNTRSCRSHQRSYSPLKSVQNSPLALGPSSSST